MLEWLLAPIDPSRPHVVGFAISWHGRMMVLAWGFLVPLGIVVARFCKITPQQDWPRELDNKAWWRGHLAFQYAGGVATVLALGLILLRPEVAKDSGPHRVVGWIVAGLAAVQFLAGWLRGTKGGPTAPTPDGSRGPLQHDAAAKRSRGSAWSTRRPARPTSRPARSRPRVRSGLPPQRAKSTGTRWTCGHARRGCAEGAMR